MQLRKNGRQRLLNNGGSLYSDATQKELKENIYEPLNLMHVKLMQLRKNGRGTVFVNTTLSTANHVMQLRKNGRINKFYMTVATQFERCNSERIEGGTGLRTPCATLSGDATQKELKVGKVSSKLGYTPLMQLRKNGRALFFSLLIFSSDISHGCNSERIEGISSLCISISNGMPDATQKELKAMYAPMSIHIFLKGCNSERIEGSPCRGGTPLGGGGDATQKELKDLSSSNTSLRDSMDATQKELKATKLSRHGKLPITMMQLRKNGRNKNFRHLSMHQTKSDATQKELKATYKG